MADILVVYYSRSGATPELARQVCRGIESVRGRDRAAAHRAARERRGEAGRNAGAGQRRRRMRRPRICADCRRLVLGSPTRFGNMAAPLKYFLDGTGALWAVRRARRQARGSLHLHADACTAARKRP